MLKFASQKRKIKCMLEFAHNRYHLCCAYFIICYKSIITPWPGSILLGKFSKIYHVEQLPRIVKMSMWHTTTKNSIYGYNCPYFTMDMWITSTNYTKANGRRDEYNWLHCKAAKRKPTHGSTQLHYRWISLWNGPADVSVILTVTDITESAR
jgi:hypothetical protein